MANLNKNILGNLNAKHGLFLLAIALAIFAYLGGLSDLLFRWNKQEEYGHGYFIPLISLWFLWNRKEALAASVGSPSWLGLALIAIGLTGLVLGEITAIFILIQFGFILTLMGLVLAYGGQSLLKVVILPILFLIFAIPLPYFIDAQLSWRLQIVSSNIGVAILRLLGNSVYLEGNVIDLGAYKLQVVEACSGLRYLYPLLSIGFLMAYMYKAPFWKRALVFFSTIPITVMMNSLRIAMVGVLVNKWGNGMADGFLHYFEGWIIFMMCLLILTAEILLFEKFGQKRSFFKAVDLPEIAASTPTKRSNALQPLIASCVMLLAATALVTMMDKREELVVKRSPLIEYPQTVGEWTSKQGVLGKDVEKALELDDYLLADYSHPTQGAVNFYVAYYGSQRKGVSPHSPAVCMPGGGWVISSLDRITIDVAGKKDFHVNRTIINKDNYKQVVYYWFEQRGRHIASEYWMKWYLLVDALQINRTDGALVRVTTLVRPHESIEKADARIQQFLEKSVPPLNQFVPD